MNNTEKLLRAIIDALGFDVEEIHDTEPDPDLIEMGWIPEVDGYKLIKRNKK